MAANGKETSVVTKPESGVERAWEPLTITVVGSLGDVLQGGSGSRGDGGGTMKP